MFNWHKSILFVSAIPFLNACILIENQDYPKEWPSLEDVAAGKCPDITGRFQNNGVCEPQTSRFWHKQCSRSALASSFFCWEWPGNKDCIGQTTDYDFVVEISQSDRMDFKVSATLEKPLYSKSRLFRRDEESEWIWRGGLAWSQDVTSFECQDGSFQLPQNYFVTDFLDSIYGMEYREFFKAQNGDIIMKQTEWSFGYITIIPTYMYSVNWYRWMQKK